MGLKLKTVRKKKKFLRLGAVILSLSLAFFLLVLGPTAGSGQTQVRLIIRPATPSAPEIKPAVAFLPEKIFFEEIYQSLRSKLSRVLFF